MVIRDQATATRILRLVTLVLCTGPSCCHGTTSIGGCTGMLSESVCFATLVCALRSQSCYSTPRPIQVSLRPGSRVGKMPSEGFQSTKQATAIRKQRRS